MKWHLLTVMTFFSTAQCSWPESKHPETLNNDVLKIGLWIGHLGPVQWNLFDVVKPKEYSPNDFQLQDELWRAAWIPARLDLIKTLIEVKINLMKLESQVQFVEYI